MRDAPLRASRNARELFYYSLLVTAYCLMRQCSLLCDVHYDEVDEETVDDIYLTDGRCADVGRGVDDVGNEEGGREDDKAHQTHTEKAEEGVMSPQHK